MREITSHKCPGLNEMIKAEVADVAEEDEKKGELPTKYQFWVKAHEWAKGGRVEFQKGPWRREKETDPPAVPNGVSDEAVLAVLIDHLQCRQKAGGSRDVAVAVTHLETALLWLQKSLR